MGANARAIEAGRFGIDAAPLRLFVSVNGLAEAHVPQPMPFAGVSESSPGDSIATNFKTFHQTCYVGQFSWRAAEKLVGRAIRCAFWRTD